MAADDAPRIAERLRAASPDVLLVLQVMAVPPGRTMRVLDALEDLPLVVWGLHLERAAGDDYDHSDIATEGATVGTSQLVSMMVRRARPLALVVGRFNDPSTVARVGHAVSAAWAARRIATGRLARVGSEPPGYDCVVCDPTTLTSATGLEVVDIRPGGTGEALRGDRRGARPSRMWLEADERVRAGRRVITRRRGSAALAPLRCCARGVRRRAPDRCRSNQLSRPRASLLSRGGYCPVFRSRARDHPRRAVGVRRRHADRRRAPDHEAARGRLRYTTSSRRSTTTLTRS